MLNNTKDFFNLIANSNPSEFHSFSLHSEALEYYGCQYIYKSMKCIQRTSKQTPKKCGQFVTLWKRDDLSLESSPYTQDDTIDYLFILCFKNDKSGIFIFPRDILIKHKILQTNSSKGKRGFRIYPLWDTPTSKQAIATQKWQAPFFSEDLRLF